MKVRIAAIIFVYVLIQVIQCGCSASRSHSKPNKKHISHKTSPRHKITINIPPIFLSHTGISTTEKPRPPKHDDRNVKRGSKPASHKRIPHVYTGKETGYSALGIYLARTLTKIARVQYDHNLPYRRYVVYHYNNKHGEKFKNTTLKHNVIVACDRHFRPFCPANTTTLCTESGRVRCVANITSTVPCGVHDTLQCVRSSVSCENNNSLLCRRSPGREVSILISCLSTITIEDSIGYVGNAIVPVTDEEPSEQEILELFNHPEYRERLTEGVEIPKPVHKFCEAIQLKHSVWY